MIKKPQKINKSIPFALPGIGKEEIKAAAEVLKNKWLTMGPKVLSFEEEFTKYHKIKNAIAVNSATAGLHLALLSLGVGSGDEVILPTYTFASCANTIVWTGAKPVFADVNESFLIDPEDIRKKITKKTKAIMVVHFGGQMAQMDEITKIAKKYKLKIIEDCAHSFGAKFKNQLAGTIGDIGVFSFYAIKNLTTGEGGMIITKNNQLAKKMRLLRLHGMSTDAFKRYSDKGKWFYEIEEAGFKYNLTDMAAAIGLEQLKKIKRFNAERSRAAKNYLKSLKDISGIKLPVVLPKRNHVWHLFPIRVYRRLRNRLIEDLKEFNIATSVHFIPNHLQPFYKREFGFKKGDFPVAEEIFEEEISLPLYPELTNSQIKYICQVLRYLLEKPK